MDFKQAIAKIEALEDGSELASAIRSKVDELEQKNYTVIGEKRNATSRLQAIEAALTGAAKVLGLTGELDSIVSSLEEKARELSSQLKTQSDRAAELESRATQAETKLGTIERQAKLAQIAAKVGANPQVFEKLFGDKLDEFKVEDDAVKMGDRPFKEYVESDDVLKSFAPALFPVASDSGQSQPQGNQPPAPKLPSGTPNAGEKKSVEDLYKRATGRSGLDWLTKK